MTAIVQQKRNPIWCGGIGFENKARISEYCVQLEYYHFHKAIAVPHKFLDDLLMQSEHYGHADLQQAIQSKQVEEYRVESRDRGLGFVAILKNGRRMPFGWRNAVSKPSPTELLKGVCRQAVKSDIAEWRDRWLARHGDRDCIICPILGQRTAVKDCHVDHVEPLFQDIFTRFVASTLSGIDLNDLIFESSNVPGIKLIAAPDDWIAEEFRRFHNAATEIRNISTPHLRLISATANLRRRSS